MATFTTTPHGANLVQVLAVGDTFDFGLYDADPIVITARDLVFEEDQDGIHEVLRLVGVDSGLTTYERSFTLDCTVQRVPECACAHNLDGSVTTMLCPVHADQDPCLTMAQVTGKRRKGSIRRGVCSTCGHGLTGFPYDEYDYDYPTA